MPRGENYFIKLHYKNPHNSNIPVCCVDTKRHYDFATRDIDVTCVGCIKRMFRMKVIDPDTYDELLECAYNYGKLRK